MKLTEWRKEIDLIDSELLKLIYQRAEISKEIGALKAKSGLPVVDQQREEMIIHNAKSKNEVVGQKSVVRVYRSIIDESRKIQSKIADEMLRNGSDIR